MKKIIIFSYHALPFDVIASYRANAYLKHFSKFGIEPTLVTHDWGSPDCKEVRHEKLAYGRVIRIPKGLELTPKWRVQFEKIPFLNKLGILLRWVSGYLDNDPQMIGNYKSYLKHCNEILSANHYDCMLGIFSPHHHLRLCHTLHENFKIPYILDFRDLWNNRVIHKNYKPNVTEKIQDAITKFYWKKWLSKAAFFSITSEDWKNKINEFSSTKGIVIHNGFDPEMFENVVPTDTSTFTIVHGGSLYEHQKLNIFLEGCKQFIEKEKPKNFKVKFIGADRGNAFPGQLSGFMYNPVDRIYSLLDKNYCEVTKRIPKQELAQEITNCQLLLFPSLPDSPGTHLGKIFDYVGSKKNILMIPDDNSVVGEMVRETKAGVICNESEEVCKRLTQLHKEWISNGYLKYEGNIKLINKYSRATQVQELALKIHQFMS
ncbi:hypothetical protein N7E81_08320 [Reichenbachiella carrageenanivorans]|uniref:Uncharacterized protein n=1 Tax=Reichenbachiella carrageenanivorans TaxID=2979869 RepID=A0ABY6D4L7_9BACT|nr:hypothetical protein [Reichenbachiella carrageenanivorans]UXX81104.1 hypothetical protein N7E81_08320 [Reichenbachiella carrageenanivorans]